jgi:hypothetical protein
MSSADSGATDAESDDPVVVYRTQLLNEADVVAEAMGRAKMPFFRRLETIGGFSRAMPVNPSPGLLPGSLWAIAVPRSWVRRAEGFIAQLPVSQEIRSTHRMPRAREMFRGWTWIFVLAILLALVLGVIRMYLL